MSVTIIAKKKSVPQDVLKHQWLVPLRVIEIDTSRLRQVDVTEDRYARHIQAGDILILLPSMTAGRRIAYIFNASKAEIVENRYFENGAVKCLRAYDIAQINIMNDDNPAPMENV